MKKRTKIVPDWLSLLLALAVLAAGAGIAYLRLVRQESAPDPDAGWVTEATPAPWGRGEESAAPATRASRHILVHCGNSMRPAAEALAEKFTAKHGIGVKFNFGGSAELLPAIELGRRGDLYLCHDPYAEILDGKGLLASYKTVGWLEPVILVPAGNPENIRSLADLARPGLRTGIPDARFATAARLAREKMRAAGIEEAFDRNLVLETRGHNEQALAVISGHIDASVTWSFVPFFYPDRLEGIDAGVEFPETRVTLCLLTTAAERAGAEKFMALAASPDGMRVFREKGYGQGLFRQP